MAGAHLVVALVTLLVVAVSVTLHYAGMSRIGHAMRQWRVSPRARFLRLIFLILTLHVVEIWLFAAAYLLLGLGSDFGHIRGIPPGDWFDYVYYSAVVYTTVGFGELYPVGPVRLLTGVESLLGLVLITWSASFTYIEMEKFWRDR